MKHLLDALCFGFPCQPSASTNMLDHVTDACGKGALQETRELPDCTAIISISGSSRVMTESSRKQPTNTKSPSHRKSPEKAQQALQSQPHACAEESMRPHSPPLGRHQLSTLQASQDGPELSDCRQEAQRSREDLKFVVRAVAPPLLSSLGGGEKHRKTSED